MDITRRGDRLVVTVDLAHQLVPVIEVAHEYELPVRIRNGKDGVYVAVLPNPYPGTALADEIRLAERVPLDQR